MSNYILPMVAAFACAISNGFAAVLQKVSADKETNVMSLDAGLLWRLAKNKLYILGLVLDVLGWIFTLYAVHYLPLFLVESIIAANIVFTALFERLFRHRSMSLKSYLSIIVIVAGIALLSIVSNPGLAKSIAPSTRYIIIFSPLLVGVAGFFLAKVKHYMSTIWLGILSGIAFGDTSIIGRIFKLSNPAWHTIYRPEILALIFSGLLGILLFSIALQRAYATLVNATMTVSQTLIPAIVGILFLGDIAKSGKWYLVIIGGTVTVAGVISLMVQYKKPI